jgi:hypothetical protein
MQLSKYEQAVLKELYLKICEQVDCQGFVNQMLGAEVIQHMVNLAIERITKGRVTP